MLKYSRGLQFNSEPDVLQRPDGILEYQQRQNSDVYETPNSIKYKTGTSTTCGATSAIVAELRAKIAAQRNDGTFPFPVDDDDCASKNFALLPKTSPPVDRTAIKKKSFVTFKATANSEFARQPVSSSSDPYFHIKEMHSSPGGSSREEVDDEDYAEIDEIEPGEQKIRFRTPTTSKFNIYFKNR